MEEVDRIGLIHYLRNAAEEAVIIQRSIDGYMQDLFAERETDGGAVVQAIDRAFNAAAEAETAFKTAAKEVIALAGPQILQAVTRDVDSAGYDESWDTYCTRSKLARPVRYSTPVQWPEEGTTAPLQEYYHRKAEEATEEAAKAAVDQPDPQAGE